MGVNLRRPVCYSDKRVSRSPVLDVVAIIVADCRFAKMVNVGHVHGVPVREGPLPARRPKSSSSSGEIYDPNPDIASISQRNQYVPAIGTGHVAMGAIDGVDIPTTTATTVAAELFANHMVTWVITDDPLSQGRLHLSVDGSDKAPVCFGLHAELALVERFQRHFGREVN